MIMPSDIRTDVEQILSNVDNYLSAYQLLERLSAGTRNQIIAERGLPGLGNGSSYTAANLVTDAAEMLKGLNGYSRIYCETDSLLFEVNGHSLRAGNPAIAFYRISP
jgi:hypothetical protein